MTLLFYAVIFILGLMTATTGPALPTLAEKTGSSIGEMGIAITAVAFGYVGGSLLSGRMSGRLAGMWVLAGATVGAAGVVSLIPFVTNLWVLVGALTAAGACLSTIDVGCNTLIVWHYRTDVAPYMNGLHLAFGIGAFVAPLLVSPFDDATTAYWLYAVAALPVAVLLTRQPSPQAPARVHESGSAGVFRQHRLLLILMALLFFLHVGAEVAFSGFIFSYAEAVELGSEAAASLLNSLFWGGFVVGRVLAIPLSMRVASRTILLADLIFASASLAFLVLLSDWSPSIWIGTFAFGLAVASLFATSFNYTEERAPITSGVTSLFLIGASLGSMTIPWVIGRLFDSRGPDWVVYVTAAAMAAALLVFLAIDSTARARRVVTDVVA